MGKQPMNKRQTQSRAALARDAALQRIGRTRRWVIAGTAVLTAGFAALVSAVAPGRSLASKAQPRTEAARATASARTGSTGSGSTRSGSTRSGSAIPSMPPPAGAGSLGLQGPDQAPSVPQQSQPQSDPSAPQSAPSQAQPQSAPVPAPAAPAVSGGS